MSRRKRRRGGKSIFDVYHEMGGGGKLFDFAAFEQPPATQGAQSDDQHRMGAMG